MESNSEHQSDKEIKVEEGKCKPVKAKIRQKLDIDNGRPKGPTSSFLIYYH